MNWKIIDRIGIVLLIFLLAILFFGTKEAKAETLTMSWGYPADKVAIGFHVYDSSNVSVKYFDGVLREGEFEYTFTKQCEPFYMTGAWRNPETGVAKESPISNLFTVCLEPVEAPVVETFIITVKKVEGETPQ